MIRTIFIAGLVAAAAAVAAVAGAEVVEEETWYDAQGKVVKTVKCTLTGADARKTPDWEPAWVLRERQRGASRPVRYYSSRRRGYGGYGYGAYWGTGYSGYYSRPRSCRPRYHRTGGFTGSFRGGSGGSRWGASYLSRGLRR